MLYDFRCNECEHAHEATVKMGTTTHDCPQCGATSHQIHLKPPSIDWGAMGAQKNAGPEFIDRFERVHKEEAAREKKRERN